MRNPMLSRFLTLPVCGHISALSLKSALLLKLVFILAIAPVTIVGAIAADNTVTVSHGMAMHGDLKYPADFTHFDYTNPDAPKGGSVTVLGYGTFDSFNPFIPKGDRKSTRLNSSHSQISYAVFC